MSYFGKYYLVGPDAQAAADWIFSNDMQKAPGMHAVGVSECPSCQKCTVHF